MKADTEQPTGITAAAGVDLAGSLLVLARRAGRKPPVYSNSPWPAPPESNSASNRLLEAGIETVGVLPTGQAVTVWVETPFASMAKARRVFPSLLDIKLPFPIEECVYAFFEEPRQQGRGARALAVAARIETLRARLNAYREAGFDPTRLDHEGFAIWTHALDEIGAPQAWRAVLYLSSDRASLAVGHGVGFRNAHEIRLQKDVSPTKTLADALAPILPAELPVGAQCEWVLTGPAAESQNWKEALGSVPVKLTAAPSTFLARSLAARALRPGLLRCNLRAGSLASPAQTRRRLARRCRSWQALAVVALLAIIANGAWPSWSRSKLTRLDQEIATQAARLAPGAAIARGQEVHEVKAYQAKLTPFIEAWSSSLLPELGFIAQTASASASGCVRPSGTGSK